MAQYFSFTLSITNIDELSDDEIQDLVWDYIEEDYWEAIASEVCEDSVQPVLQGPSAYQVIEHVIDHTFIQDIAVLKDEGGSMFAHVELRVTA